jgi:hypothetical protein
MCAYTKLKIKICTVFKTEARMDAYVSCMYGCREYLSR